MFFIPWSTDAPIYYWPFATVTLIAINVLAFLGELAAPEAFVPWMLVHGEGLHPLQWITANFLHADFGHILGNMMFLWIFGLIVEGKVGWWRFTVIYLAVGAIGCAACQVTFLGGEETVSLGASLPIYGLMAIALIWAPRNDVEFIGIVVLGFFWRTFTFDVAVMWMSIFYIVLDFASAGLGGFELSTPVLHISGALAGFPIGIVMLKRGMVDCEGWDIFAVLQGRTGATKDEVEAVTPPDPELVEKRKATMSDDAARKIALLVSQGQGRLACQVLRKAQHTVPDWRLAENDLLALIRAVDAEQAHDLAVPLLVEYLQRFPGKATKARLKLAQLLLEDGARPRQALGVLAKLPPSGLPEPLEKLRRQLTARAKSQAAEGVMELAVEDW